MQKFTPEQITQYLYDEAPDLLKQAIEMAIKKDAELKKVIVSLRETMHGIDSVRRYTPSQKTIDAIMNYAKQTNKKEKGTDKADDKV